MPPTSAQEGRLAAIGAAAAEVLRLREYHLVRTEDVAAAVRLEAGSGDRRSSAGRRSAVWLYNEVKSRRVLVSLAAYHAWTEYRSRAGVEVTVGTPRTMVEAFAAVAEALGEVARFHRAERFLMIQVDRGIGDIATSEKRSRSAPGPQAVPPEWARSTWGRVAAEGWAGRCAAFADFLVPVIVRATETVTALPPDVAADGARSLSDLAFRAFVSDLDGPVERLGNGLAAYWFERDLVSWAGPWVRSLYGTEQALEAAPERPRNPRAHAALIEALAWRLLAAGTLHARGAREGERLVALLRGITEWPEGPAEPGAGPIPGEHTDLRALCDAASRWGLALAGYGDLGKARSAYELSREVAARGVAPYAPTEAESFAARAGHNLADLDRASGRPGRALAGLEVVLAVRENLRVTLPADEAWRRWTQTVDARARAATAAGQVVRGVLEAEELVADRRRALGNLAAASTASARITLGEALFGAGHPLEARHHIEEAHHSRRAAMAPTGYGLQHDRVALARIALTVGDPDEAMRGLTAGPVLTDWFMDHVSFRLGFEARRLAVLAAAADTGPGSTVDATRALLDRLTDFPVLDAADPLRRSLRRDIAEALLHAGDPAGARRELDDLLSVETAIDDDAAQRATTLGALARTAAALGEPVEADALVGRAEQVVDDGVDPNHPVLLTLRYEQALREADRGQVAEASARLASVLRRTPLAHGRPPLGEEHPVLIGALDLADRIGLRIPSGLGPENSWETTDLL